MAGGSTITQQTAKIVYTQQERTMSRKLTELMDAAGLEKSLSKKQILELYLNRIYLGSAPMAWTARRMSISAPRRAISPWPRRRCWRP